MQAYTDILPPTAVNHAAALPFIDAQSRNLAVAKTSLLQIFDVSSAIQGPPNGPSARVPTDAGSSVAKSRLRLVGEYHLSGNITALGTVKLQNSRSGGHALLVATEYAKISIIEWDPEAYHIATVSIHYYEGDQLPGGAPWAPEPSTCTTFLAVDPNNRCAALKFGQRNLAIIPFRQAEDDLVEDDYDPDLDGPQDPTHSEKRQNGDHDKNERPYAPSFVLPLTALDTSIINPVHLAFLHEYREPTVGVLSSSIGLATSLNRSDIVTYTVFTLDLEQKARTPLLSVPGLPCDLFKVVPLPLPVGGTLLVGGNEFIHVDQAGKTHALGVNEFARKASKFPMTDGSKLALRLEHSVVVPLGTANCDMLVALLDGSFAILSFRMDGRTVAGLSVKKIPSAHGGECLGAAASCASTLAPNVLFLGSHDSDALLISCTSQAPAPATRKRSHAPLESNGMDDSNDDDMADDVDDDDDDDEDDLYGIEASVAKQTAQISSSTVNVDDLAVIVLDRLPNLASQTEPAIGRSQIANVNQLEIGLSTGRGLSGGLAFLQRGLALNESKLLDLENVRQAWSVRAVPREQKIANRDLRRGYDNLLIVSHRAENGEEASSIHTLSSTGIQPRHDSDFDTESATLAIGVLQSGSRIVQVLKSELKCYDPALDFPQIIPMTDERTDSELKIIHCSFSDHHVLVIREDHSAIILQADSKGELEEIDQGDAVSSVKWLSGSLYDDAKAGTFAALLSTEGSLQFFQLPDLSAPAVKFEGFPHLPLFIASDYHAKRMEARATLREILLTTFGDVRNNELYLMIRTDAEEITIYRGYQWPTDEKPLTISPQLRWRKIGVHLPPVEYDWEGSAEEDGQFLTTQKLQSLRISDNVDAVQIAGKPPRLVVHNSKGLPTAFQIRNETIVSISPFDSPRSRQGLLALDKRGRLRVARLPQALEFHASGWTSRTCRAGGDIDAVSYHVTSGVYAVGLNQNVPFRLPMDDWHPEWAKEPEYDFKPMVPQGSLRIFNSSKLKFLDEFNFPRDEAVLCVKALSLEVSENTHERKVMIAVGTTQIRGEDNASMGVIYIFEVIDVVPEPGKPETHWKLKRVAREEMRGAVTSISEIGTQGFLIHAQGQRCMVRGLKEDNSILPIAFQDVQMYVTVLRNLKGTGFALVGDAVKGLWFVGFSPDPYRMLQFGKSRTDMEVLGAEFLPDQKQLYIVIADAECNMHVLEYNPEHPKSLAGQRLLSRSTFYTGNFPRSLDVLPSSNPTQSSIDANGDTQMQNSTEDAATAVPENYVLLTTRTGALGLITPLDEQTYRRLGALQTHLSNILDHACSLNPRAYRAVEAEGGSRGVLDGNIIRRWSELGSQRKQEALTRAGSDRWEITKDVGVICGEGLGYI